MGESEGQEKGKPHIAEENDGDIEGAAKYEVQFEEFVTQLVECVDHIPFVH